MSEKDWKSPHQYYEEEIRKRIGVKSTLRSHKVDTESEAWQAAKRAMDASDAKSKNLHASRKRKIKSLLIEGETGDL